MKGLHDKLVTSRKSAEKEVNGVIFAAGPLTEQPGSTPYRYVLVEREHDFVVWKEKFDEMPKPGTVETDSPSHFSNGHYFSKKELVKAVTNFGERIAETAEFMESLYREDA